MEKKLLNTTELTTNNFSLEHIESQTNLMPWVWQIGNLIPLSSEINSKIGDIEFKRKLPYYQKSELKITLDFYNKYKSQSDWTDVDVIQRTKDLAKIAYANWAL